MPTLRFHLCYHRTFSLELLTRAGKVTAVRVDRPALCALRGRTAAPQRPTLRHLALAHRLPLRGKAARAHRAPARQQPLTEACATVRWSPSPATRRRRSGLHRQRESVSQLVPSWLRTKTRRYVTQRSPMGRFGSADAPRPDLPAVHAQAGVADTRQWVGIPGHEG